MIVRPLRGRPTRPASFGRLGTAPGAGGGRRRRRAPPGRARRDRSPPGCCGRWATGPAGARRGRRCGPTSTPPPSSRCRWSPAAAVLVPLAHDEPMLRFGLSRGLVRSAAGLAFMTPEERRLVDDLHGLGRRPEAVVGAGLDPAPRGDGARARAGRALPRALRPLPGPRRPGEGARRARARPRRLPPQRGLAGPRAGRPARRWTSAAAGLGPDHRLRGRGDARRPARRVRGWWCCPRPTRASRWSPWRRGRPGRPTLATARSEVLAGQTARSGGGLLYVRRPQLLAPARRASPRIPSLREMLGTRGARFAAEWTWDACAGRWRALLAQVARPSGPGPLSG